MSNRRKVPYAFVTFIISSSLALALIWNYEGYRLQTERSKVLNIAVDHANAIQITIERALSSTHALAALVRQGNGIVKNFDVIGEEMLDLYPKVSNFQLAPDGIVTQIVPLKGNEKVIGLDQLHDPKRSKEAVIAKKTGKLTFAGPFELLQGGLGAVGRMPVYLHSDSPKQIFWGFTVVMMRFPESLEPANLSQLQSRGLNYELWRIHPDTGKKQIIAASSTTALIDPVEQSVDLPNNSWKLSVAPSKGWNEPKRVGVEAGVGLLLGFLLSYLVKLTLKLKDHKEELEVIVTERTNELRLEIEQHKPAEVALSQSESRFRTIFENSPVAILEEDFSRVKSRIEELRRDGVTDFRSYFGHHPDELKNMAALATIREVNQQSIKLVGAESRESFVRDLSSYFTDDSLQIFKEELIILAEGGSTFQAEIPVLNSKGERLLLDLYLAVPPAQMGNLSRVLVTLLDITERKDNEKLVQESKELLSEIIRLSPVSMAIVSQDGTIEGFNQRAIETFGYVPEDLPDMEQWWHKAYPDESYRAEVVAQWMGLVEKAMAEKSEIPRQEYRVTCMDGSVKDTIIFGITVLNKVFVMFEDITEQKKAREQLLRIMGEQQVILDNSPVGICLLVDRRLVWINEKMAQIARYPKSELEGDFSRKLYPSQEAYEQLDKEAYPIIAQGHEFITLQELVRGDGSHMWARYNGRAVDPSDLSKGSIWILEDITERKQAEEQQSQYAAIISSTTDAIISKTLKGLVTSWNPAAEKMFGYTQLEMLGHSMARLMPPDRLAEESGILSKIELGENIQQNDTIRIRNNGEVFPVSVTISPIIDKSGTIVGASTIVRDLSELKKTEQEKQILEQQLLQAQKLESLGALAGGIAHDFNNILAIIVGRCTLAEMDRENAVNHIPEIEKAAQRAAELCRQMLAYAGKEQFVMKEVNIGELIAEMVTMLKATINKNVAITSTLVTDLPPVKVDANQIRQVVMNLIINASEAIGSVQGEVNVALTRISVTAEQREKDHLGTLIPPGYYACLEITDSGCGMNEETKRRIFEPFYSTKFTGRGLGMSAVLGIITAHTGALQLFSEPGNGSIFKVYLPV